jgi:hypothetical protein
MKDEVKFSHQDYEYLLNSFNCAKPGLVEAFPNFVKSGEENISFGTYISGLNKYRK